MQAIAPIRALPIGSRLLLALGCGLFVLVGQSLLAYRTVAANRAANDSALHARDVIAVANEALTAIIDMQNGFRGYVLTGDSSFLDRRAANRQLFEDRLNHLVALSADLPDQVARWRQVEARLATWEQTAIQPGLALRLNSVDGRVPVEVAPIIFDSQAQVDDIRSIFAEAIGIEQAVEDDRSRAAEDANALLLAVMFFGTLLTGAVGFGLIWLMARDMRGELARVANAASAIAAGDLDQRVDGVRTFEIAQTAAALNRVAAALKRDVERLRAIIAAQADIAGAEMQPDVLLNLVAERAQALTGATGAVIELVEDQEMVFRAASGTVGPSLGLRLQMAGSLSGLSVRTGETLYCEDTSADERVDVEACRRMGAGSMVVTPLVYDGQTIGVLKVLSPEPRAFSPRDIDTLQLAAGLLGTALAHAHAFQDKERSEARFRAVTESAHEAIIAAGPEGRLMFWNPAAIRLFDYEPAELLDMPFERILPDRAALVDLGRAGGSTLQTYGRRKDGTTFTVELSAAEWQAEGKTYWTGIMHDITERQIVERMKDELISVVSHELRTPLTSIRGSLGLLAGGLLRASPEKAQRMLEIAVQNTDRLMRLINDFLDLERLQSGRVELRPEACLAGDLVRKATDEMRAMAVTAGVELRAASDEAVLSADADRIVQVLTNLLSNAIKFSPGGGVVQVSADLDGDGVVFAVQDGGRGIPAAKLDAIFDRFQQVDPSDARKGSGTGLGLAIARGIVEQHGGRIWVQSLEGEGSTFKVRLPLRFTLGPTAVDRAA